MTGGLREILVAQGKAGPCICLYRDIPECCILRDKQRAVCNHWSVKTRLQLKHVDWLFVSFGVMV